MFRWIGLTLLVMCVCALLQGATLFAGIDNGYFNEDLSNGWTYSIEGVEPFPGTDGFAARLLQVDATTVFMGQRFVIDPGMTTLSFDLRFEYSDDGDPDIFSAYIIQDVPVDPIEIPGLLDPDNLFYSIDTEGNEIFRLGANPSVSGDWTTISLPVFGVWGDVELWFALQDDPINFEIISVALIDNVELTTTVPEPATMTLGLIGVGVVGMIRRRMR